MIRRLAVLMPLLLLVACATSPTKRGSSAAPGQSSSVMGQAMQSPLRDLNMGQAAISPILLLAMADVYALPATGDCAALADEISALEQELGDDLDLRPFTGKEEGFAAGVLSSAIKGLMPYRSILRRITGADVRARRVAAAITAGGIRRGYLKGLGEAQQCGSPAAPDRSAKARMPAAPPSNPDES